MQTPWAVDEVNRFVKTFYTLTECKAWAGGRLCLSKLGLITRTHPATGRTKRRLILDCKESNVNSRAWKGGRLMLLRTAHVLDDAMALLKEVENTDGKLEWLVLDFSDWVSRYHCIHPRSGVLPSVSGDATSISGRHQCTSGAWSCGGSSTGLPQGAFVLDAGCSDSRFTSTNPALVCRGRKFNAACCCRV